jgi:hypothetical protein
MRFFDPLVAHLSQSISHPKALRCFHSLLYVWFLFSALLLWNERHLIWGMETVLLRYGASDHFLHNLAYGMMYDLRWYPYVFYPHVAAAALSIGDYKWSFIPRIITWATGILLYYAGTPALNGGFLIALLMAFYAIPATTKSNSPYRIVLTNLSFYAAVLQVLFCYVFAGYYKLTGEMWRNGEALYYTLHIDRFSSDFLQSKNIAGNVWLMMVLNYVVLGYQLLFPVLVFVKKWKWVFLALGTIIHLVIGAGMHLWDFALILISCYALFLFEPIRWYPWGLRTDNKNESAD